ncbi:helix-turn-helix transcriptional regulator [Methylobacterium sp. BE186]|uniref:helix-turn-helix domain-containing protein n=1 Tax=Methylobacterium sp. BE186 TaxID=2817715 RepID=UPI00286BF7EF|nr:helix-turn-helix transcriptional regulator [Methylobacterium sp. BE186]
MDGRARVAWHLRRLRTERGLSQESLAVDAAVDRTYVSGIERGTFNPSVDLIERLAKALAVDVAEFFTPVDASAAPPQPLRPGRRPAR